MRVSQVEIAQRAGVTQAAVSMILGGKAEEIPTATRDRVLRIARELGYRADPLARRLASGRGQLLGLFTYERIFSAWSGVYQPVLLGIEEAAEESGHDLLLFTSAATDGPTRSIYANGENKLRLVDAAILVGRDDITAELEALVDDEYPFVFIGRRFLADGREVPNVSPGYEAASRALADRLAAAGHRTVGYLGANPRLQATEDRLAGLRGSGALRVSPHFLPVAEIGEQLIGALTSAEVTAIVTENTVYASAVRAAADRAGIYQPDTLSIVVAGVVENTDPDGEWSGFSLPGRAIGRLAVEELLARLDRTPSRSRTVECPSIAGSTLHEATSLNGRGARRSATDKTRNG